MRNIIMMSWILFISCAGNKSNRISGMPTCLDTKIKQMKSDPRQSPPQSVTQYDYKGKTVFYVVMPCCDQFNIVYDAECNYLGAPDGGITGKGDRKLLDFSESATNPKVVYSNK